jgi:SAM-dependent methyltransferase
VSKQKGRQGRPRMDLDYWNYFYSSGIGLRHPSPFAQWALPLLKESALPVIDVGCGNGRDTLYFADSGIHAIGLDQSLAAINRAREQIAESSVNCSFHCSGIEDLESLVCADSGYVLYSRFLLHALSDEEEESLFSLVRDSNRCRVFLLEARTVRDDIKEQGVHVKGDVYRFDHHRRFIRPSSLLLRLEEVFERVELKVATGLAVNGSEDPSVVRVSAWR